MGNINLGSRQKIGAVESAVDEEVLFQRKKTRVKYEKGYSRAESDKDPSEKLDFGFQLNSKACLEKAVVPKNLSAVQSYEWEADILWDVRDKNNVDKLTKSLESIAIDIVVPEWAKPKRVLPVRVPTNVTYASNGIGYSGAKQVQLNNVTQNQSRITSVVKTVENTQSSQFISIPTIQQQNQIEQQRKLQESQLKEAQAQKMHNTQPAVQQNGTVQGVRQINALSNNPRPVTTTATQTNPVLASVTPRTHGVTPINGVQKTLVSNILDQNQFQKPGVTSVPQNTPHHKIFYHSADKTPCKV